MRVGVIRPVGCLVGLLILLPLRAETAWAQATARVRVAQENFRREANGRQLATVLEGAELPVVTQKGNWVEVDLQGWIWARSVASTDRNGFDLRVSADGGENLRAAPQGRVVARLLEGFLLERVTVDGNWVRVRRRGWLWKPSLAISGATGPATPAPGGDASVTAAESMADAAAAPLILTASASLAVQATPDGDTVAVFQPGAQAQVLGRTGDWIRVRVDGWVYGPAALDSLIDFADTGDLSPARLRADPGRYKGALVRWRVQFISLRRAERARTDFEEGEPFLLARGPAGDAGFVYLAVPEELLAEAEALEPLEFVTVVGRVRTGRSKLLGSPVVDLTDIEEAADKR